MKCFILYFFIVIWELSLLMNLPKYKNLKDILLALIFIIAPLFIILVYKLSKNNRKSYEEAKIEPTLSKLSNIKSTSKVKTRVDINDLPIHKDVKNLLWIGDGQYQNFYLKTTKLRDNLYFQSGTIEPSTIFLELPISKPAEINSIPKPGYYPNYRDLSPEQRWIYWKFLSNPYDKSIDIVYVFIFYYGLERFVLAENRDDAFYMIIKLISIHQNNALHNYAINHLVCASILKNKITWANSVKQLIEINTDINTFPELIMMLKYKMNIPLYSSEIIRYSSRFGFTNKRYINTQLDLFINKLEGLITLSFGAPYIIISEVINSNDLQFLEKSTLPLCANYSISNRDYKVPNIFNDQTFKIMILNFLQETHEQVKQELKEQRKNN